jgi:ankyrin repeat protein
MNWDKFLTDIFHQNISEVANVIENAHDFDINFWNKESNETPLSCAIEAESSTIVELLLNNGADPNSTAEGISLPLLQAIEIGREANDYNSEGETNYY